MSEVQPERVDAPWPYYTQRTAAKRLGVDVDFLSGMVGHAHSRLRAVRSATHAGNWITLYNKDDIDALAAKVTP